MILETINRQVNREETQPKWSKVKRYVYKLQKRIYRATIRGDFFSVRQLQRLLINSWYARLWAVKQVTRSPKKIIPTHKVKQALIKLAIEPQLQAKLKRGYISSQEAVGKVYRQIAREIEHLSSASQESLINALTALIQQLLCRYQSVLSKKDCSKIDYLLKQKLWQWALRRHPHKGKKWIASKYWKPLQSKKIFATSSALQILPIKITQKPIIRAVNYNEGAE